ncbi:MAG: hypothetical protein CM15mP12_6800 [Gammaproteobacteria bacterium]|nr:MAG: hypothetical protein CM15mP12_6800 [Gammaproteobacteria bacterium]
MNLMKKLLKKNSWKTRNKFEDNPEEEEEAAVISFEECEEKIKLIKREHNKYLKSLNNRKLDPKAQKLLIS